MDPAGEISADNSDLLPEEPNRNIEIEKVHETDESAKNSKENLATNPKMAQENSEPMHEEPDELIRNTESSPKELDISRNLKNLCDEDSSEDETTEPENKPTNGQMNEDSDEEEISANKSKLKPKRAILDDDESSEDQLMKSGTVSETSRDLHDELEERSAIVSKLKTICDDESSDEDQEMGNGQSDDENQSANINQSDSDGENKQEFNKKLVKVNEKKKHTKKKAAEEDFDGIRILQKNAREADIE